MRRLAAHMILQGNIQLPISVVEIKGDKVVAVYPLFKELPMTEWLDGTILIKEFPNGYAQAFYGGQLLIEKSNNIK